MLLVALMSCMAEVEAVIWGVVDEIFMGRVTIPFAEKVAWRPF